MDLETKIRVLRVVEGTSVDGPGLRTSIYFAGCRHHCPGCHNPQSWAMDGGDEMSLAALIAIVERNEAPVTLSGGDPLAHPAAMLTLTRAIKQRLGYNIWCYTGYTWERIMATDELRRVMDYVDVVVDGPFILAERDEGLLFRGSRNQRLIDVAASLHATVPRLLDLDSF